MRLTSPSFQDSQPIPVKFTCDGDNVHPTVVIADVPKGIKSLSLKVEDPDSPNSTFTHWILTNINPQTKIINENEVPVGSTQRKNDFGEIGYGGPCPHQGMHHYIFSLDALDAYDQIIASAKLIGTYAR